MKTLNEVIKAKELCNDHKFRCHECSYYDDDNEVGCRSDDLEADALQYLKAYREDRNDLSALRAYWAEQQANPALTWDELKQMEGKPVWFEYPMIHVARWILLDRYEDGFLIDATDQWHLSVNSMDKWQAYRKERE